MKTVLVTGGAMRLGAAISSRFGEAGWHVVVHFNRSGDAANALAAQLPSAETVQFDMSDEAATIDIMRSLAAQHKDWRCLINCAAVFEPDDVTALDPATNREAMQINATTPMLMAQTYLAHARAPTGRRVVQITDQKLANMNPDFFSYTTSKCAVDGAARMLAMGVADNNVGDDRVYRLAPGAILESHDQSPEEAEASHKLNLLARRTQASEIADAALFMAEGPLANGQELFVDSGQFLLRQPRDVIYLAREGGIAGG